jgi:hypothetical protein
VRLIQGRLVALSVRAAMVAGGWVGFALGLVAGSILGASISWLSGAVIGWQRQLALSIGVTEQLLPFGDQVPVLETLRNRWYLVIPAAGCLVALLSAVVGALLGGLVATSYNRSPYGVQVIVELPDEPRPAADAQAPVREIP